MNLHAHTQRLWFIFFVAAMFKPSLHLDCRCFSWPAESGWEVKEKGGEIEGRKRRRRIRRRGRSSRRKGEEQEQQGEQEKDEKQEQESDAESRHISNTYWRISPLSLLSYTERERREIHDMKWGRVKKGEMNRFLCAFVALWVCVTSALYQVWHPLFLNVTLVLVKHLSSFLCRPSAAGAQIIAG